MKWYYCILLLCVLASCNGRKNTFNPNDAAVEDSVPPKPPPFVPASTGDTACYLTGLEKIWCSDTVKPYYRLLRQWLNTAGITLVNKEPLHSSREAAGLDEYEADTLSNSRTHILLTCTDHEEKINDCKLLIDGKKFKAVNANAGNPAGVSNFPEDLEIHASSFRHFVFKGRAFYYFTGGTRYHGGSADAGCYYFIYDTRQAALSWFYNFRVDAFCPLGDLNGDAHLDFVFVNNDGGFPVHPDTPNYFQVNLFSHTTAGIFALQKDKAGKPWTIEGHTGAHNLWVGGSLYIQRRHWPKPFAVR